MKKYWLTNTAATLISFLIIRRTNHYFLGTKTDLYIAAVMVAILSVLGLLGVVYLFKHWKKAGIAINTLACFSLLFQLLVILFIVNGILWNTDTGTWN